MVTAAAHTTERRLAGLVRRCYAGLDAQALRQEIATGLAHLLDVDAAFVATVDPATLLMTGVYADEPLRADGLRFLRNELTATDVNTFAGLATGTQPAATLDVATAGDRASSERYTEIMAPLGLGDELRAALRSGGHCWGVVCLHRADGPSGFGARELGLLRRVAPHLGEGLRRAAARELSAVGPTPDQGPGFLVLGPGPEIVSASAAAQAWLADLDDGDWSELTGLPVPVSAAVASLAALESPGRRPPARVQVRTRSGAWLSICADYLDGPGGRQVGVMLEPISAGELRSRFLLAHNLTPAQERVATLVLQGRSTKEIAAALHISVYTVQEHLTSIFDKVGVRSRRELAAALMGLP